MGLSLMRRGLVGRVVLAVRDPAGRVDLAVRGRVGLGLAVPVDLAHIRDPVGRADLDLDDRVGPVGPDLAVQVDRAVLGRADQGMDRVDPADRADRVGLDLVDRAGRVDLGMDRVGRAVLVGLGLAGPVDRAVLGRADQGMDRVDPADRAGRVGLDLDLVGRVDLGMDRVDPVGRVDRAAQAMNPVDPADLVDRVDRAGREDLGDRGMNRVALAVRVDRHQRRTRRGVLSTGVVPRWAAPGMCRTASARPATVRLLRHHSADGAGMAGPRPERRRLGGTDRRPRVAGAVRRLPVVGTVHGMVRRVTGASRNAISGRSITTGTTRSRCSTRSLGDGASGSLDSGFLCTETT